MIASLSSITLCLAIALYNEARGEPEIGQKAVASVILERSKTEDNKIDICGVIYQPHQFSGIRKVEIKDKKTFKKIYTLSSSIVKGTTKLPIAGRKYFNTKKLGKRHTTKYKPIAIGNHYFY